MRAVLAAGASVAQPDVNGGTPLHYAAQMCGASYDNKLKSNSSKLALEILGILLAHPQSSVDVQDKDGRQPLLWAASAGSAKAVIALVKAGARVESADKWVEPPFALIFCWDILTFFAFLAGMVSPRSTALAPVATPNASTR